MELMAHNYNSKKAPSMILVGNQPILSDKKTFEQIFEAPQPSPISSINIGYFSAFMTSPFAAAAVAAVVAAVVVASFSR